MAKKNKQKKLKRKQQRVEHNSKEIKCTPTEDVETTPKEVERSPQKIELNQEKIERTPEAIAEKKIQEITEKAKGGKYIFRGESMEFDTPISSNLYRQLDLPDSNLISEHFVAHIAEENIVEDAKQYFPSGTWNIDILTKIQHRGGKTALIDFTYNLYIALYFACAENFKEAGKLYLFDSTQFIGAKDILYKENERIKDILIKPNGKSPRVIFQSSVFIHACKGYLNQTDENKIVTISPDEKEDLLTYLNQYCDINKLTIYNDIQGFIQRSTSDSKAEIEFYRGWAYGNEKKFDKAIEHYDEAIRINPQFAVAYNNRGFAKFYSNEYEYDEAISDFNKAIKINPQFEGTYNNIGLVQNEFKKHGKAILNLNKAIEINPQFAKAHYNRSLAQYALGKFTEGKRDLLQAKKLAEEQNMSELSKDIAELLQKIENKNE